MYSSNKIHSPHLNSDIYRTQGTGTNTLSYFDYIKIHADGFTLVGCSELTGRFWNGGANVKSCVQEFQKELVDHIQLGIQLKSGTADGCFIDGPNKLLLCEDSGTVSIWTCSESWSKWSEVMTVSGHDDIVMAVDCLDTGKLYVTVGMDGHAKVWDITELICVNNYKATPNWMISDVSVKPNSTTDFVICSMNQSVSLWKHTNEKCVLELATSDCGVRCVQWLDENWLVFGNEAGVLSSVDIRAPGKSIPLLTFPAPVHRIIVQDESENVAVCCDNRIVSVYEISDSKAKCLYEDQTKHTNHVRGLAWDNVDKNVLHSVGWDGMLATHKSENVAVCCDNRIVSVYEISDSKAKCLYEDQTKHTNHVRGLAWDNVDKNVLHSVGWDGMLATHKLI